MQFILAADIHLDKKQYGIKERTYDFQNAFYQIIEYTVNEKENTGTEVTILLAGDIIDTKTPSPLTVRFLIDIHNLLVNHRIKTFFISGNHERSNDCEWLDAIKGSTVTEYGFINLDEKHEIINGVSIYGISQCDSMDQLKKKLIGLSDKEIDIILLHTPVSEVIKYEGSGISIDDIPQNIKISVVGDTHICTIIENKYGNAVISCGSTEITSKGEDKEKYFLTVVDGKKETIQKHKIRSRTVLNYKIETESDLTEFQKEIHQAKNKPLVFIECTDKELFDKANIIVNTAKEKVYARVDLKTGKMDNIVETAKSYLHNGKQRTINEAIEELKLPDEEIKTILKDMANPDIDCRQLINKYITDAVHTEDTT